MTSTSHHNCPIAGCQTMVPTSMLMCRSHWHLVPKPLQDSVYHYYRKSRGGPSHRRACRDAIKKVEEVMKGQVERVQRMPYAD